MNKRQMKKAVWSHFANHLMLGNQTRRNAKEQVANRHRIRSPAALKRLERAIDSVQKEMMRKLN